jgi:transcriptional regulator with XRE-family HTH domain
MTNQTINDRVKILRTALEMTQQQFADKIKLKTGNTLSMIERGENTVTEQNIALICTPGLFKKGKEVNSLWLKYGENSKEPGSQNMFIEPGRSSESLIYDISGQGLPEDEIGLISIYRQLTDRNQVVAQTQMDALLTLQEKEAQGNAVTENAAFSSENKKQTAG